MRHRTLLLYYTNILKFNFEVITTMNIKIRVFLVVTVVRDDSVGITTSYGLDGPGFEPRWGGARFYAPVQTGPGTHAAFCTMGTWSFPGVKRPGRGVDHPPPSSAEVKERVELYFYSSPGLHGLF